MNIKHLFWTCASQIYFMWIVDFIKMLICQLFYIFKLGWQAINESERVKRDKAGLATFLVKQFKNLNGLRFLQIIKMEKALFFCFKYVLLKKHYFFPSLFLFFLYFWKQIYDLNHAGEKSYHSWLMRLSSVTLDLPFLVLFSRLGNR